MQELAFEPLTESPAAAAHYAFAETESGLAKLVDAMPALAWRANADGWITWYNRRWYEYTGTTPLQMEGWGWQSVHDPKALPVVMQRWSASIKTAQPFEMVFPLRGTDGVYRSFLTRIQPVCDAAGAVVEWVGTNTEVDELQRMHDALRWSEERLRMALSAARGMGAFDWKVDSDVLQLDAPLSRMFWIDPREGASGMPVAAFFALLHPDDQARVEQAVSHAVRSGEDYSADYRVLNHDGEVRWIAARGVCQKDGFGEPSRFLGVCQDMTERKLAEQALMQSEKLAAVGRLAASIAHEINNPLEAVTNLLYLARQSASSPETIGYIETAEQELRRASAITGQTLRFHRQSTRPTSASCTELFSSVLALYEGRLRNAEIRLEKRKRTERRAVCFEGEIRQVLSNLVGNAIDAMMPHGGRLLLRSRDTALGPGGGAGLVLTIADSGPGMSKQTRARLFEAFYTTKGELGTGLGLWISHEIVQRHKGRLTVRSSQRAGSTGTVFRLFLPFDSLDGVLAGDPP